MQRVLKRIAVHGLLTAAVLAAIGLGFAELATLWLAASSSPSTSVVPDEAVTGSLRYRVPLTLAAGGFLFVALGELLLRRRRAAKPAARKPEPDPAELLLEQLLAELEAKKDSV